MTRRLLLAALVVTVLTVLTVSAAGFDIDSTYLSIGSEHQRCEAEYTEVPVEDSTELETSGDPSEREQFQTAADKEHDEGTEGSEETEETRETEAVGENGEVGESEVEHLNEVPREAETRQQLEAITCEG